MTDITNQPDIAALANDMVKHLGEEFPAPLFEMQIRQGLALAEEAGEAVGALRRYLGVARRPGSLEELEGELADVVFTAYIMAHYTSIDLDAAIARKAEKIFSRGWRVPSNEPNQPITNWNVPTLRTRT